MYKGFKIKITKDSELFDKKFEEYRIIGEKQQNKIQKELKEYEKNLYSSYSRSDRLYI